MGASVSLPGPFAQFSRLSLSAVDEMIIRHRPQLDGAFMVTPQELEASLPTNLLEPKAVKRPGKVPPRTYAAARSLAPGCTNEPRTSLSRARTAPSLAKRARLDGSAGCPSQRFPEPGSTTSGSSRPSIDK